MMKIILIPLTILTFSVNSFCQDWQNAGTGNPLESESSIEKIRLSKSNNQIHLLRNYSVNNSGVSMDTLGTSNDIWGINQNQNNAIDFIVHDDGSYSTLEMVSTHFTITKYNANHTLISSTNSLSLNTFDIWDYYINFEKDSDDNLYISFFDLSNDRPKVLKYNGINYSLLDQYAINENIKIKELHLNSNNEPYVLLTRADNMLETYDHIILKHNGTSWETVNETTITSSNLETSKSTIEVSPNDSLYLTFSQAVAFSSIATICRITNGDTTIIAENLALDGETLGEIQLISDKTEKLHLITSAYSLGWYNIHHYQETNSNWYQNAYPLPNEHDSKILNSKFSAVMDTLNTLYLAYSLIDSPFEIDPDTSYFVRRLGNCETIGNYNTVSVSENNEFHSNFSNANSYQWITCDDNTNIDGETNQTYEGEVNISYAVVINKDGCIDTSECAIRVNDVGIEQTENIDSINIFPNPATNTIQLSNLPLDLQSISIYDLTGRLIKTYEYAISAVNISDLKAGIYWIEFKSDANKKTLKFVKK